MCVPCSGVGAFLDGDKCVTSAKNAEFEAQGVLGRWSCQSTFIEFEGSFLDSCFNKLFYSIKINGSFQRFFQMIASYVLDQDLSGVMMLVIAMILFLNPPEKRLMKEFVIAVKITRLLLIKKIIRKTKKC